MNKDIIAVLGARGLVGELIVKNLLERGVDKKNIVALTTKDVAEYDFVEVGEDSLWLKNIKDFDWNTCAWLFVAVDAEAARKVIPEAVAAGVNVIDNSSALRMDPEVPLIIPEVNAEALRDWKAPGVVSNPNCTTIQMLIALEPIRELYGLKRIDAVSFQSVSGQGQAAINELAQQTQALLNGQNVKKEVFPEQIAFNILPAIGDLTSDGYALEEGKMRFETQKILGQDDLVIAATTVRVPIFYGHGIALHIETEMDLDLEVIKQQFKDSPRIEFHADEAMVTPLTHAVDSPMVHVARVRDGGSPRHVCLWVVADNTLRGGALNALDIYKLLELKAKVDQTKAQKN